MSLCCCAGDEWNSNPFFFASALRNAATSTFLRFLFFFCNVIVERSTQRSATYFPPPSCPRAFFFPTSIVLLSFRDRRVTDVATSNSWRASPFFFFVCACSFLFLSRRNFPFAHRSFTSRSYSSEGSYPFVFFLFFFCCSLFRFGEFSVGFLPSFSFVFFFKFYFGRPVLDCYRQFELTFRKWAPGARLLSGYVDHYVVFMGSLMIFSLGWRFYLASDFYLAGWNCVFSDSSPRSRVWLLFLFFLLSTAIHSPSLDLAHLFGFRSISYCIRITVGTQFYSCRYVGTHFHRTLDLIWLSKGLTNHFTLTEFNWVLASARRWRESAGLLVESIFLCYRFLSNSRQPIGCNITAAHWWRLDGFSLSSIFHDRAKWRRRFLAYEISDFLSGFRSRFGNFIVV